MVCVVVLGLWWCVLYVWLCVCVCGCVVACVCACGSVVWSLVFEAYRRPAISNLKIFLGRRRGREKITCSLVLVIDCGCCGGGCEWVVVMVGGGGCVRGGGGDIRYRPAMYL